MHIWGYSGFEDIVLYIQNITSSSWFQYSIAIIVMLSVLNAMKALRNRSKPLLNSWAGEEDQPNSEREVPVEDTVPKTQQNYTKQPLEAVLVLDVEGTCDRGSTFSYPNEIIELPVSLMTWNSRLPTGEVCDLSTKAEFHTFVRPTWKPTLTPFCSQLTGITQQDVDKAPTFPEALASLQGFLSKHGVIDATGEPLMKFCWCTDGPYDIRDFMVKQAFISQSLLPPWMKPDIIDVREMVAHWCKYGTGPGKRKKNSPRLTRNIAAQLRALQLPEFEGREHSGRDDTRNVSRILAELARRGVRLQPNLTVNLNRRWPWMRKDGTVDYDKQRDS